MLLRGFVELTQPSDRRLSVTVQLPPTEPDQARERAKAYLGRCFDKKAIVVEWADAGNFAAELHRRWHGR